RGEGGDQGGAGEGAAQHRLKPWRGIAARYDKSAGSCRAAVARASLPRWAWHVKWLRGVGPVLLPRGNAVIRPHAARYRRTPVRPAGVRAAGRGRRLTGPPFGAAGTQERT
ncbi:hypothetical protein DTB58_33775, partial [Streptomyces griseus]|nr:hypothetical protein [Streptomyces griseus]